MEYYKEYLYGLRKVELAEVYVIVSSDATVKLKEYVRMLGKLGLSHRPQREKEVARFCTTMRQWLSSFLQFRADTLDVAARLTDFYIDTISSKQLVELIDQTLLFNERRQDHFNQVFSNSTSTLETKCYKEMIDKSLSYTQRLLDIKDKAEMLKNASALRKFADAQFKTSLQRKVSIMEYTHEFIALKLAKRTKEILSSLHNSIFHLRLNLKQLNEECARDTANHREQLIDCSRHHEASGRGGHRNTLLTAETASDIEKLERSNEKIETTSTIVQVREELKHNEKLLEQVTPLADTITELKKELSNAVEQERQLINTQQRRSSLSSMKLTCSCKGPLDPKVSKCKKCKLKKLWNTAAASLCTAPSAVGDSKISKIVMGVKQKPEPLDVYPFCRSTLLSACMNKCWFNTHLQIKYKMQYIQQKLLETSKALMTLFTVKGSNDIFEDNIGQYIIDTYGHRVYSFDYNSKMLHVDCDGNFITCDQQNDYFRDRYGSYYYENGEKIYQLAPCTSQYKLGEDDALHKVTKDCGHSETVNKNCRMTIGEPHDSEIVPDVEAVDLKSILNQGSKHYLWNELGGVLTYALRDVSELQPKNPIHYLAHRILAYKYGNGNDTINKINNEARMFREDKLRKMQQRQQKLHEEKKRMSKKSKLEGFETAQDQIQETIVQNVHTFLFSLEN